VEATERVIDLARRHEHRTHILHVTTADEVSMIAESGGWVTGEACPHHLWFTEEDYARLGGLVQMNPPVKTAADREALWEGLRSGRLSTVGTDHAPHLLEEKRRPYPESPSGMPSVEFALPLLLTAASEGKCDVRQIAQWMGAGPARIWNVIGKGEIRVGYDADLTLADPERSFVVRNEDVVSKCGWSAWEGERLTGTVVRTIVGGRTVYSEGSFDESVRGRAARFRHPGGAEDA
jgi:dihydroorotase